MSEVQHHTHCGYTHHLFLNMAEPNHTEPLADAKDVKRMLKVSLPLVYKLAENGRLPCVRIPCPGNGKVKPRTLVRFKMKDVYAFIEAHYNNS